MILRVETTRKKGTKCPGDEIEHVGPQCFRVLGRCDDTMNLGADPCMLLLLMFWFCFFVGCRWFHAKSSYTVNFVAMLLPPLC
jgi:hypothetical protein